MAETIGRACPRGRRRNFSIIPLEKKKKIPPPLLIVPFSQTWAWLLSAVVVVAVVVVVAGHHIGRALQERKIAPSSLLLPVLQLIGLPLTQQPFALLRARIFLFLFLGDLLRTPGREERPRTILSTTAASTTTTTTAAAAAADELYFVPFDFFVCFDHVCVPFYSLFIRPLSSSKISSLASQDEL